MAVVWPWTVRRMLCTRGLPEELASMIARRSFARAPSAKLVAWQRKLFIKRGCAEDFRIFIPRGPLWRETSHFICDMPKVFFGRRLGHGNVYYDCCERVVKRGEASLHCSVCQLTVCERCWHRLSDSCVCARGFCSGPAVLYDLSMLRRLLYDWRRGASKVVVESDN